MNIAIIGTGNVGTALGTKLSAAGHNITFGSRHPAEHPGSVTPSEAIASAELIITAIPGKAVIPMLEAVGEKTLGEKIVLDPSVAVNDDGGLTYPNDSLAHHTQKRFPKLKVIKTLNTMNTSIMIEPFKTLSDATVFVSGDSDQAKTSVKTLLKDLGWTDESIFDLGGVATATATEHLVPLFFATYTVLKSPVFSITITRKKG